MRLPHSERLILRPVAAGDLDCLLRWLSDPALLEFYEGRDQAFDAARVRADHLDARDEVTRCIVEHGGRPVGYLQFYPVLPEELAEYGYQPDETVWGMDQFLGEPPSWGRGLGTELVRIVSDWLLRERGADKVAMDPQCGNARALRCYEKAGFRRVRLLPERALHEGEWRDSWLVERAAQPDATIPRRR